MKNKILTSVLSAFLMVSAYADHHEAPGPRYIMNIQNFTTNMAALLATHKAFADSGALNERQVGMAVYQINAGGRDGANAAINFFYMDAASLPPPNVMIQSDAHVKTFMQSNEDDSWVGKGSSIYESIHQVGQLTPDIRVFEGASIKALSPDYPEKAKKVLADTALEGVPYGIQEVVIGGYEGETHRIWWGYKSQAEMLQAREKNIDRFIAAQAQFTPEDREIIRTWLATSLLVATPE